MTPFQGFRLWARRAPFIERAGATVAGVVMLAALCFAAVPAGTSRTIHLGVSSSAGQGSPGTSGGNPALSGSPGSGVAGSATGLASGVSTVTGHGAASGPGGAGQSGSGGPGGTGGPAPSSNAGITPGGEAQTTGAGHCTPPPGSDTGVTATQIKVAVLLVNVAGPATADTGGFPAPSEQQQNFQQVIASVNATGGVACRKLVADFYSPNIADESSLQQVCLQVQQGGYFSVVDVGTFYLYPSLAVCFPQAHIPYFGASLLPRSEQQHYYPYLFGAAVAEAQYRTTVFALEQRGFFAASHGFTKLGLLYRDCEPQYIPEVEGWLQQAGVPSSKVVAYDLGCSPTLYAPPSSVEQAVLKFQQAQARNVLIINDLNDFANFTTIAQQQGYHPLYGSPDDGEIAGSSGQSDYNYQNMDGMTTISFQRYGEETTPGLSPTSGTATCNAIYTAHGRPPVYRQPDGAGGVACDMIWELAAAIDHAPSLQRGDLATGLQAARSVDFSYPFGPDEFAGQGVTTGGEFWRPVQFYAKCTCWHVVNPTFQADF